MNLRTKCNKHKRKKNIFRKLKKDKQSKYLKINIAKLAYKDRAASSASLAWSCLFSSV